MDREQISSSSLLDLARPYRALRQLNFLAQVIVLTLFMLMEMPAPGTSSFIGPAPRHFLLCKSPGAGQTFWCKSPGVPGGMVTSQIDTCITHAQVFGVG